MLQQILDLGRFNFLPVAPYGDDFGIFEKPVQRAFQKFVMYLELQANISLLINKHFRNNIAMKPLQTRKDCDRNY